MLHSCICLGFALLFILSSWIWIPLLVLSSPIMAMMFFLLCLWLKVIGRWGRLMRLLYEIYEWIMFRSDKPRKYFWQKYYNFISWGYPYEEWKTMNLGFTSDDDNLYSVPQLDSEFQYEKFNYQLYHYLISGFAKINDLNEKHILEIGSGRGGGLRYMAKTFKPLSAVGVDYSAQCINFSKKYSMGEDIVFYWGDAERLPLKNESADLIICVDSSHCFGNLKTCLTEVKRVLKPGGDFIICDFIVTLDKDEYEENFSNFLEMKNFKDLTENTLLALKMDSKRKIELVEKKVTYMFKKLMKRFAVIEGSVLFDQLEAGDTLHLAYHFTKP